MATRGDTTYDRIFSIELDGERCPTAAELPAPMTAAKIKFREVQGT